MKSLGGGNKAIDTIKSPHKRETFYEIRNIAHKKENKENIKERLFRGRNLNSVPKQLSLYYG